MALDQLQRVVPDVLLSDATTRRRIGILSFTPLAIDARVLRQAEYLAEHFDVTVLALGPLPPASPAYSTIELPAHAGRTSGAAAAAGLLAGRVLPAAYTVWTNARASRRVARAELKSRAFDLVIANEWPALLVALETCEPRRVLFDAHEFSPEEMPDAAFRLLRAPLVRRVLRSASDAGIVGTTVSDEIAGRFRDELGLELLPVLSAPRLVDLPAPRPTSPERIRVIHHGAAMRERRLETMIDAVARADHRFELTMMLVGDPDYVAELKSLASRLAGHRVKFAKPVSPGDIVRTIAAYDLGLFILDTSIPNYAMAMPNKLFDFVAAGLGVVIGPSPAMAAIGRRYGFALVAESFAPPSVARSLNGLTAAKIDVLKDAARRARLELNADVEMKKLVDLVRQRLA